MMMMMIHLRRLFEDCLVFAHRSLKEAWTCSSCNSYAYNFLPSKQKEEEAADDESSFPDSGTGYNPVVVVVVVGPCKVRVSGNGLDGGGVEERGDVKSPNPNRGGLLHRHSRRLRLNPNRIRDDPSQNPNRKVASLF